MKRHKSRTLLSRTLSRVKSRITSFGTTLETESPNPLIAPPAPYDGSASPNRRPRAYRTVPQRSPTHDTIRAPKPSKVCLPFCPTTIVGVVDESIVQIAALSVKTSTWTVFGTHAKYPATAYINIEVSCVPGNDSATTSAPAAGQLYDLAITPTLKGSGAILKRYGHSTRPMLATGQRWTLVLHVGIQDTSLAARLSTSFKSLSGRLGKISNMDVINRWLDVLQKDTTSHATASRISPQVQVKISCRHSLLPETTTLTEERTVQIAMTELDVERAEIEGIKLDGDSEDDDEERLQEMRVMGAPWL